MTIDDYLVQLAKSLTVAPETQEDILQEVRDHLVDAAYQLTLSGTPALHAEDQAVAAFGNAAQVARRFNAVHPVYWDQRRYVLGLLWGTLATWGLWTLLCFPLLIQLTAHPTLVLHSPTDTSIMPWTLFLSATPLGFGMFSVLAGYGVWFVPLFLVLYCLTPFLWGRQAQDSEQPGLAFGLGALLGFIWLPPAILAQWPRDESAAVFVFVGAIWLLAPLALLAAWAGRLSLAWKPGALLSGRARRPIAHRTRRVMPTAVMSICFVLVLVGMSAWSFVRAAQYTTLPPIGQQMQMAQENLPFALRQPTFLPPGMVLTFVSRGPSRCQCASLLYQGGHGATMNITEIRGTPIQAAGPLPPGTYQVWQFRGDTRVPTWWLGTTVTSYDDISISWVRDGIGFNVYADATLSVKVLQHVADSL